MQRHVFQVSLIAVLSLPLAACQSEPVPGEVPIDIPVDAVTYEDVAPLLARSCVSCHQPGGIAPFSLSTFEEAKQYGPASKAAVLSGSMPPLYVKGDGSCGSFDDPRFLTAEEAQLLASWVDQGAMRRDPGYRPPAPPVVDPLDRGTQLFDMGVTYTPQGNVDHPNDDYRCFFLDPASDREQFVTGYEVMPGDPRVVHHIIVMSLKPEDEVKAAALEAVDDRPGWDCFTGAGEGISYYTPVVTWAPGSNVDRYPEGTGLRLRAGQRLVMQVHYNLTAGAQPDRTRLRIELQDAVESEARILLPGIYDFELEPGKAEETIALRIPLTQFRYYYGYEEGIWLDAMTLYGAGPHMHLLGRKLRLSTVEADRPQLKERQCLVQTDRYDFNWQLNYYYREPVRVGLDEDFYITCSYDTSSQTEPVYYGEGTGEEMCLAALYVTFEEEGRGL